MVEVNNEFQRFGHFRTDTGGKLRRVLQKVQINIGLHQPTATSVTPADPWDALREQLVDLNKLSDRKDAYYKVIQSAFSILIETVPEEKKPTPSLVKLIVDASASRFCSDTIASVEELRYTAQRELATMLPDVFKTPLHPAVSGSTAFVIIDLPDYRPQHWRPFKNALSDVISKDKIHKSDELLYIFSTTVDCVKYTKVGVTAEPGIYAERNRYAPMIKYTGNLQIQRWGVVSMR